MRHGKHWCRLCQGVSGYTLFRDNNSTNPSCKALYPFCLAEWTPKRRMRQGGTRLLSSVRPAKYKGRMALRKKLVLLVLLSRKGGEFIVSPKKSQHLLLKKKKKTCWEIILRRLTHEDTTTAVVSTRADTHCSCHLRTSHLILTAGADNFVPVASSNLLVTVCHLDRSSKLFKACSSQENAMFCAKNRLPGCVP